MITGIAHINILVPPGTLDQAEAFYAGVLGFTRVAVPKAGEGKLAWFDITPSGQQLHVASGGWREEPYSTRHPCFKVESPAALLKLRKKVWEAYVKGGDSGPVEADEPGKGNSGDTQGEEFPSRFFARDFAGNRLEFSL